MTIQRWPPSTTWRLRSALPVGDPQQPPTAKKTPMRQIRWFFQGAGAVMGTLLVLIGCTYDAAVQRLSLAEQSEFYTYRKIMTTAQEHTYLAKATAAERTAYLSEIGLAQRFQALDPLERDAVKSGWPRVG